MHAVQAPGYASEHKLIIMYSEVYYCMVRLLYGLESLSVTCVCREADITKERIQKILSAGANVILTTGGIDDLCLKYFVESGSMAVRRCKKVDLRRIAKATGGKLLLVVLVPLY